MKLLFYIFIILTTIYYLLTTGAIFLTALSVAFIGGMIKGWKQA